MIYSVEIVYNHLTIYQFRIKLQIFFIIYYYDIKIEINLFFMTLFFYSQYKYIKYIGGINDKRRKIKISYREHVKYLLRLNSDRFRTHRSFIFVVFNIIQRSEARHRINLLIKQQDYAQFTEEINKLTLHDFDEAARTVTKDPFAKYNSTMYKLFVCVEKKKENAT